MAQPRLWFDGDGVLHVEGLTDPVCPECGEPIRLMLDLTTFVATTEQQLAHARCVWRPQVFYDQAHLADAALVGEERRRHTG
jgi:hypothetical protein